MISCPACRASAPDGARFCPSCGQVLSVRGDERRVVTVLFADIVGYTSISEGRDPEHVKYLVDRCFQRLVSDLTDFGGRVDKIVGDAIIALFGAPIAHEDDAERAVRAALLMQQTITEMQEGIDLRVGINTGEVLVGAIRAGGDYTAMGDVMNVASRLQTLAAPGQVVVGSRTHAATADVMRYESLGTVHARGREEPVDVWVALEALAPPGYRPLRARSPLVGRDPELRLLRGVLDTAASRRRAGLVLLLGEAGLGKSRLAEELADIAVSEHGAEVLDTRCVPYGEANVWWPLAEAVRQAAGIIPSDDGETACNKVRHTYARTTGLDPHSGEVDRATDGLSFLLGEALADVDPTRAREEARRAMTALLEGMAAERPLVFIISELHWADVQVMDMVGAIIDELRARPVVLLGTARTELQYQFHLKNVGHNAVMLNLDPLGREDAAHLLEALLGSAPSPDL